MPSAAVVDSQSLRAAETADRESRDWDQAKKVNGRNRHIAVNALDLLLAVLITLASRQDRGTWAATGALVRRFPDAGLRLLFGNLSTLPARRAVAELDPGHRARAAALFSAMRSGRGFARDLDAKPAPVPPLPQPALVVASRHDGSVPFTHARALAATHPNARLVESTASSHLVWFSRDWPAVAATIRKFLAS